MIILSKYKSNSLIAITVLAAILAACSSELRDEGHGNLPHPDGGDTAATPRREVLLSLKNQLSVKNGSSTKAEMIATLGENKISTLDVYVFGSPTEDGTYVYQERFAYRETGALPTGATELELELKGNEGKETTALLSLKKGLYVKLYCIANLPEVIDPADETTPVADDKFIPLQLSDPANGPVSIVGTGAAPEETTFLTFHTPLLKATAAGDTLVCPLPMSGAYTTPLDLTDFATSARMQAGLKLTRMVARFDIINNAAASRFTITEVSMGKGRRGANFFPVKVYGTQPAAADGELITYPARNFWGTKANAGIQTGAFYCYPSPEQDLASLVLKGKYKVNQTEEKDVTYQVPFRSVSDGNGNYIEIAHNHRYTVAITDADEYHLDFTIHVSDWSDDGNIDDYEPENIPTAFDVTVPTTYQGITEWDAASRTMSMSLRSGSSFTLQAGSNSALSVSKTYAGNAKEYDWLAIADPVVTTRAAANSTYSYAFSLNPDYDGTHFPRAIVRFIDVATGNESVLMVRAILPPDPAEAPQSPDNKIPNALDSKKGVASIYRVTDNELQIKLVCPEGAELVSKPTWMDVTRVSEELPEGIYSLKLTNKDVTDAKGEIVFRNRKDDTRKMTLTVQLQEPISQAAPLSLDLVDNAIATTETITSFEGFTLSDADVDWGSGGAAWFKLNTTDVAKDGPVTVKTQLSAVTPDKVKPATVKLKNKIAGERGRTFTVTPVWQAPTAVTSNASAFKVMCYKEGTFTVNLPFGGINAVSADTKIATVSTVAGSDVVTYTGKYYSVTGDSKTVDIAVANAKDATKTITYTVNVQNLTWAEGNLVADGAHGAKIGAPTDYGLLFRGGSLIGYDNFTPGDAPAVLTPLGYSGGKPVFTASPNNGNPNNAADLSAGTGDPCKVYLGGKWRVPTAFEFNHMGGYVGNSTSSHSFTPYERTEVNGVKGCKAGPNKVFFFPFAGSRHYSDGNLQYQGGQSYIYSSSPNSDSFYSMAILDTGAPYVGSTSYPFGFSIRCVREP